jgi:hypothetical protein
MGSAIQLNVPVTHAPGSLASLTDKLRAADVNINAISATEGRENVMVHLIVDDPETAKFTLQPHYKVTANEVLAFKMHNTPGAIASISRACAAAQLNIRNIYATTCGKGKEAMVYVVVENVEKAKELLKKWEKSFGPLLAP